MFKVFHYNFGMDYDFATLAEAKAFAVRANFDATIYYAKTRIASYSPISGWRDRA